MALITLNKQAYLLFSAREKLFSINGWDTMGPLINPFLMDNMYHYIRIVTVTFEHLGVIPVQKL